MIWQLTQQTDKERTYINQQTNTEVKTKLLHIDQSGNRWWCFHDLMTVPYIRKAFSQNITTLFEVGLSAQDLKSWIERLKTILKSNDVEKYEKAFALVLDIQTQVENTADPLKQYLALATVFVLEDTERIDYFSYDLATQKLALWKLDELAQAFFLNWLTSQISYYSNILEKITLPVLNNQTINQ